MQRNSEHGCAFGGLLNLLKVIAVEPDTKTQPRRCFAKGSLYTIPKTGVLAFPARESDRLEPRWVSKGYGLCLARWRGPSSESIHYQQESRSLW